MVHDQGAPYPAPQCFRCTLHFAIVLYLTVGTQGLHKVQAQDTVDIFPVRPTLLAGTSFNLSCTAAQSNPIRGEDIRWSRDGVMLSNKWYSALDDKTSLLIVENAVFADSGLYACVAGQSSSGSGNSTEVFVGVPPSNATDLSCSSTNHFDVTCKWEQGIETNINTSYTLQYYLDRSYDSFGWFTCPLKENCDCSNGRMCTVKGTVHGKATFLVLATNKLGYAHSQSVSFSIDKDTVPNPPRNVVVKAQPHSQFHATWEIPQDWKKVYKKDLIYKLEYRRKGSSLFTEETSNIKDDNKQLHFPTAGALLAYTTYCIRVAVKFVEGKYWSSWSNESCATTLEEAPDAMLNATWSTQPIEENPSLRDILITWQPLLKANERGLILGYFVTNVTSKNGTVTTLDPTSTNITIPGLDRFTVYKFAVEAFNGAGSSPRTYLDITAENSQSSSAAVIIIAAGLAICAVLAVSCVVLYVVHRRLTKPVPNISFIALDRFEEVSGMGVHRGAREREMFDDLVGYHTANGVLPNGDVGRAASMHKDEDADYVRLRQEQGPAETFPLLRGNSSPGPDTEQGSATASACRKMSQASADSAHSSEGSSDKDLFSAASSTVDYGQFASLFVEIPEPSSVDIPKQSGVSQPRLDSTDSGFMENCREYRVPSYTKLTTIPSESGMADVDNGTTCNNEDDYHSSEEHDTETVNHVDNSDQSIYTNERSMPSYTRLSSLVGPMTGAVPTANGTVPSVGNSEHGDT